jgi:hypothetical protein
MGGILVSGESGRTIDTPGVPGFAVTEKGETCGTIDTPDIHTCQRIVIW